GPDRALDGAKLRFSLADGEARLDDVVANFAGGKVGGRLGVRRGPAGDLALEGQLGLKAVRITETPWKRDGRDVATGTLDADMTVTAEGGTVPA
ncbi:hypothetical protein J8J40_26625, partial [Mycobacterium tuberculosis]|nr:hypothetical protein [Mycobacterium tuberculosis]